MEQAPRNATILIVEDDGTARRILQHALAKHAFDLEVAGTGARALCLVAHKPVDLILMDIMLPDIDGLEIISAIRAMEAQRHHRRVPIVAMTALAMEADELTDVDAYLRKPFLPADVISVISKLLPRN